VLQIISRKHNVDFHHSKGETWPAKPACPDGPGAPASCRVNNFSSEQLGICWRKYQYCGYELDENNGLSFDFIDNN
jgi:hypothetical protein